MYSFDLNKFRDYLASHPKDEMRKILDDYENIYDKITGNIEDQFFYNAFFLNKYNLPYPYKYPDYFENRIDSDLFFRLLAGSFESVFFLILRSFNTINPVIELSIDIYIGEELKYKKLVSEMTFLEIEDTINIILTEYLKVSIKIKDDEFEKRHFDYKRNHKINFFNDYILKKLKQDLLINEIIILFYSEY